LDYAALDAQVALQVYQQLTEQLRAQGRLEIELRQARLRVNGAEEQTRRSAPRATGPDLRPLTAEERVTLERLRVWRKELAGRERVPLYMICPDKTLEHLVITRPSVLSELNHIYGLGPARIAKYGEQLLELVR
jgi:ATP-dependent DNA helicase RecQ